MLTYRPDHFKTVARTEMAERLWHWLQQPAQMIAMRTAIALRRPPVEALSQPLSETFPDVCVHLRIRQMIGHMVRQILLADGHRPDRSNVRIRSENGLFRRGATYT